MARKVEELMVHEKFQKGTQSEIRKLFELTNSIKAERRQLSDCFLDVYLDNAVKAQRMQRSVYAFGLNRERPGYFTLSFKTNMQAPIQTLVSSSRWNLYPFKA
jgi:transcription elongation factor SPT6